MTDEVLDPHLTTKIVSSYVRHHTVGADQVSDLITSVHRALVDASIDETGIVAFLARRGEEARLLYSRPDRIGMGAGTQLIEATKATGTGALELWCFQANELARRFHEARGFHAVRFTDGADDEEQMRDVRYRWERRSPQ